MRIALPIRVTIAALAGALSLGHAAAEPATGQEQEKSNKKPAAGQERKEQKALSTIGIDEFTVTLEGRSEFQAVDARPIAEIVNPFSVRKRGRVYGSLYEYHRNDNFDARNFFDPVGKPLPEYKRNQFGGSLGFFLSERLSLFGTYDGLRIHQGSTLLSHVPTPEMKQGDFGGLDRPVLNPWTGAPFPRNRIPESMIHPVARRILPVMPDPNRSDPYRNFVNNQPAVENHDSFTARVDFEFSERSKLFVDYSLGDSREIGVHPLPVFGSSAANRNQEISLHYNRTFSSSLLGSLRLQFERDAEQELSDQAGQSGLLESLGITGLSTLDDLDEGYPETELSGYASPGSGDESPRTSFQNDLELELGFTYVRNSHKLEFGGELGVEQVNDDRSGGLRRGRFEFTGDYTGDAFADFLLGLPSTAERGVGSDRADLRRKTWRLYLRDDWKINSRLNLSMSLSYNYFPFFYSIHDNVSTFAPLLFDPPGSGKLVVTGSPEAAKMGLGDLGPGRAVRPDRNDWEPRIGLAVSPLGNNRLVVRTSFQIDYDSFGSWDALDVLGRNYPFYYTEKAVAPEDSPDLDLSDPFRALAPTELNIRAVDPDAKNSYTQQWRISVENEFLRNWNLDVSYEGRKSTGIERTLAANVPEPGPGPLQPRRPNPDFGRFAILTSSGSLSGHTLEAALEKRLSRGFSIQTTYQWNRMFSDDYGWDDPSDPRNLRAERAPVSDEHMGGAAHSFQANYIFDLPVGRGRRLSTAWAGKLAWIFEGWRISGITTFATGMYFHPVMAGDPNNDGVWGDRPDRIGPGNLDPARRSIDGWFAAGDFAAPPEYGFGDSGRNILVGPGKRNWDISMIKRTRITEGGHLLEFRVQLFNAFNHANFDIPEATFGTEVFGRIFGAERAREIEVALKYSF